MRELRHLAVASGVATLTVVIAVVVALAAIPGLDDAQRGKEDEEDGLDNGV